MSKVNLKGNIWIEGFDKLIYLNCCSDMGISLDDVIFKGETSEIPEEVAKECVRMGSYTTTFYNYITNDSHKSNQLSTAKQSIQSACDKPYCIIYKTKQS